MFLNITVKLDLSYSVFKQLLCSFQTYSWVSGQPQRSFGEAGGDKRNKKNHPHPFCSTWEIKEMFVSRWHRASRVDLWVSYQNISGSQDLHNSKPNSLIAQQLLLNINYVILLHFLISYGCAEHFFFLAFDKAANPVWVCVSCLPCPLDRHTFLVFVC